jgi:hypothetical protein
LPNGGFKKKLYQSRPKDKEQQIETHFTKQRKETVSVNSASVERKVREMLAQKISGTHVGLWLLVPEHLRLGTWNLLTAWTGLGDPNAVETRLALQMVHESALCVNGIRQQRTLRQKGFETLNGLPFVATDQAIHKLLDEHTFAEAASLQLATGQLRQARGDYPGQLILLDPHRIATWSKRQMQLKKATRRSRAGKVAQTFFAIDAESGQPLGFGMGSSAVTTSQATLPLIDRLAAILPGQTLLIADAEHFTTEILDSLSEHPKFTILLPTPRRQRILRQARAMNFTPLWAGYAVAEGTYQLTDCKQSFRLLVQRTGEKEDEYDYKPFVTTSEMAADQLMTLAFPQRWNIEEFFNTEAALGWNRASTLNLHIRYGRLSMALIGQAVICGVRQKLPGDINNWTAESIAKNLFAAIDGDIRVKDDTIIVTFYNAPDADNLKQYYENLPMKLEAEGIDPKVPWLYNFKVDFRFK